MNLKEWIDKEKPLNSFVLCDCFEELITTLKKLVKKYKFRHIIFAAAPPDDKDLRIFYKLSCEKDTGRIQDIMACYGVLSRVYQTMRDQFFKEI